MDFKVALVGIDDDIEVGIASENFRDNTAETFLKHAYESRAVDVFCLFELLKGLYHARTLFFFLCCHS